jgi:hypothetical protein
MMHRNWMSGGEPQVLTGNPDVDLLRKEKFHHFSEVYWEGGGNYAVNGLGQIPRASRLQFYAFR